VTEAAKQDAVDKIDQVVDAGPELIRRWVDWAVEGQEMALAGLGTREFADALAETFTNYDLK